MEVFRPELQAFPLRAILDEAHEAMGEKPLLALLAEYKLVPQDLRDASAWVSLAFVESLLREISERSGIASFVDQAALRCMTPKYIGPLYPLLFAFGSPVFTFRQLARAQGRFNKTGTWACEESRPGFARMSWTPNPVCSQETTNFLCRFRGIQLSRFPALFDLLPAQMTHPQCILRGDPKCIYEARWEERPPRRHALLGLFTGTGAGALLAWAAASPPTAAVITALGFGIGGWALGRTWVFRQDLVSLMRDMERHNDALDGVTRANEQRYAELLEAKAEVEKKVELRTSELSDATQRLSATLSEIQALDRAKTDFFNNVSHELRSPLTLILAPLEDIVAGRTPPGGQRSAFEVMHRNAARLLHLINQLLDLAKIDAGAMQITLAPTDLLALVKSTLTGFEAAAHKKNVTLDLQAPTSMPAVAVDAPWIESALTNLLANALRLTPAGGFVRVCVEDHGGDVSISVADDGPGIASEDQTKIFERFAQADSSKRVIGGTGIGLALVREAARLHGGDIALTSEPGKGATFTLRLPRRPGDLRLASIHPATSALAPAPLRALAGFALDAPVELSTQLERACALPNAPLALVVEDNPELREFIVDVLAVSYRVRAAKNGAVGLALAIECKPDVVISDVAMPEMDGYQLCRALRAERMTRAIPVLLVTARTDVAGVLEGFEAGANDYVLKPFHGRELLARVDVHVRLRRMVQELALRERHATLGVLAASVAHQVRNPLTTLVSGLPAMQARLGDRIDASTRGLIEIMIDCAGRIERLTRDLMDLSRVDRDTDGDYRPSDGLQAAIRMVKARIPENVTIEETIAESPVTRGRPGDMNHVFLNLLDNAVRAVSDGGRIRVEGSFGDEWYTVRVSDSGKGIDEETARRIFEPFFTTRQAGEGTGLGLAIARQVMQQGGGTIEVGRSELGGAAFTVQIPLTRNASSFLASPLPLPA